MGNKPSTPEQSRSPGAAYPGAADPYPRPTREEAIAQVMGFTGVEDAGVVQRVLQDFGWDANQAAQSLLQSGGTETMEITLPHDAFEGMKITVDTPRGRVEVEVPAGLGGGDVMTFRLPVPAPRPEVVVARPVGAGGAAQGVVEARSVAESHEVAHQATVYALPAAMFGGAVAAMPRGYAEAPYGFARYDDDSVDPAPRRRVRGPGPGVRPTGSMPPPPGRQYRFL